MTRFIGFVAVLILVVGCSQSNSAVDVSKSTTPASFNTAGAPTVEFTVPDMMCPEGCGAKVKEILAEQPARKMCWLIFLPRRRRLLSTKISSTPSRQSLRSTIISSRTRH